MLVGDSLVIGELWDRSKFTSDLVVDEDKDAQGENNLAILERDMLDLGKVKYLDTSILLLIALDTLYYLELKIKNNTILHVIVYG